MSHSTAAACSSFSGLPSVPGSVSFTLCRPSLLDCPSFSTALLAQRPPLKPRLPGPRPFPSPPVQLSTGTPVPRKSSAAELKRCAASDSCPCSRAQGQRQPSGSADEGLAEGQEPDRTLCLGQDGRTSRQRRSQHAMARLQRDFPDWRLLPAPILGTILQKAFPEDHFPRPRSVGLQVLGSASPEKCSASLSLGIGAKRAMEEGRTGVQNSFAGSRSSPA